MRHITKQSRKHASKKSRKGGKFSTLTSSLRSGLWDNDAIWRGSGQQMRILR